jgi:glycosyltransferase involved in cell wall biosynthesis
MESKFSVDISVVFPTMNEGRHVSKVLDEIIEVMKKIDKTYEVIMLDTPSDNPSMPTLKEYAEKYDNFYAIQLSYARPAGSDKSAKYMIGFQLARGEYIFQIDSDGQDNPADMPKFIEEIEEGYDMVTGYKQNRKDGEIYMLTSKISNFLTSKITGTDVHDMNCGFKLYRSHVAKSLNLRGRWYRFIPSILVAKGFKISEVPIENRKRKTGKTNFSFINRLQGGVFDMLTVVLLNLMGETPIYFFGWIALLSGGGSIVLLTLSVSGYWVDLFSQFTGLMLALLSATLLLVGVFSYLTGLAVEFRRKDEFIPLDQYGFKEVYPELPES